MVQNFIASRGHTNKVGKQEILHYNKKAVARVYHLEPSGYVVATLNKNDVPIKAYSFSGNFDDLPEEYKEFLSARLYEYGEMIEEAEKTQVVDSDYKKVWNYLETYTENSSKPIIESSPNSLDSSEMPPELPNKSKRNFTPTHEGKGLLNTNWKQGVEGANDSGSTYNRFTFTHFLLGSGHTKVGCAPLAWGQIMRYHEWPLAPRGTTNAYSYLHNQTTIPVSAQNLTQINRYGSSDTTNEYHWNLMLDSITSSQTSQKEAISKLLVDIGYSLHANWGISGTTAWTHGPNDALPQIEEHFGYSTNMHRKVYLDGSNVYSANEEVDYNTFVNSIKTDIDNLRPILFGFGTSTFGHASVIDGYQNISYYPMGISSFEAHINFGIYLDDNDFYLFSQSPILNPPHVTVGTLVEVVIVTGIKPCTNSAGDCRSSFSGNGKQGLTLQDGWNLVSLIGNNDDINYADFTNASYVKIYSVEDYGTDLGRWITSPSQILPLQGIWVYNSGTKEYVFPGAQTEAVELNTSAIYTINNQNSFNSGDWALIGTGKEITDNRLNAFNDCERYDKPTEQWVNCMPPNNVPAGSGMWIQKK